MSSINDLPASLLIEIFSRTELKIWVTTLPGVCRFWQETLRNVYSTVHLLTFRAVSKITLNVYKREFFVEVLLRSHGLVGRKLKLRGNRKLECALKYFFAKCPNRMNELSIQNGSWYVQAETYLPIGSNFKNLRKLYFKVRSCFDDPGPFVETVAKVFSELTNLEELHVFQPLVRRSNVAISNHLYNDRYQRGSVLVESILSSCKKLRILDITCHSPAISIWHLLKEMPLLEEFHWTAMLEISASYFTELLRVLAECSNHLYSISFKNFRLYAASPNPRLNRLSCQRWMNELAKKPIHQFFVGVEFIGFDIENNVDNVVEKEYHNSIPGFNKLLYGLVEFRSLTDLSLHKINFSLCSTTVSDVLKQLAPQLTKLSLRDNIHMDDSFFNTFPNCFSSLTTLDIGGRNVDSIPSEPGLTEFVFRCAKLEMVKLHKLDYWVGHSCRSFDRKLFVELLCRRLNGNLHANAVSSTPFMFLDVHICPVLKSYEIDDLKLEYSAYLKMAYDKKADVTVCHISRSTLSSLKRKHGS